MKPSDALNINRDKIKEVLKEFPTISNVRVIGSVARGEDTDESDIDFIFDHTPETSLFVIGRLQQKLELILKVPVHITSSYGLKQYFKNIIKKEAINI